MPDPITSDWSPYSYCYNSLLMYYDLNGEFPWVAVAIGMYIEGTLANKEINPKEWDWEDPTAYWDG